MKIRITQDCVGCGQCVAYCPNEAITVFGHAVINENCIQCGKCVSYCPVSAIKEVE